jgi:hypothetical protein
VLGVVLAREQQQGPLPLELGAQGLGLAIEVRGRVGVRALGQELCELKDVVGALLQGSPQADLLAQGLGLAEDPLGRTLIVPEPGLAGARVQLGDPSLLGGEVKDAPRSTGSARPGRGWTRGPSRAAP